MNKTNHTAVQILHTFYQRMMPLFPPQAEQVLKAAPPAAFNSLAFRYTFSVAAMTKISHIIEDQVLQTPRAGALHASFQYLSRVLPQQQRYARIASTAGGLWLYFEPDVPAGQAAPLLQHPQVQVIDTGGTPLRDYWFVVAYGEGLSMTLLAHEVPALTGHGRFYEGFYTFQPDTAYQVLAILHQIYPDRVPAPPPPANL